MKKVIYSLIIILLLVAPSPVFASGEGLVAEISWLVDAVNSNTTRIIALEAKPNVEPELPPQPGPEPLSAIITGFTFLASLDNVDALQGVASDGTYLYISGGTTLYKTQKDGTIVTQLANPQLEGTDCNQVNGIFYKDGLLYIGAVEYANYDGYIKVFSAGDLSYVEERQVESDFTEGAAFHDGYWWVIYNGVSHPGGEYISQYSPNWNLITHHPLSYPNIAVNGILWIGDYLYVNNHDDTPAWNFSDTLDVYLWTGSGFQEAGRLPRPSSGTGQGISKEPNEDILWWVERNGGGAGVHNVIKTSIDF